MDTVIRCEQSVESGGGRTLWLFHLFVHGEDRLWWAYFQDGLEMDACLTEIVRAFPCLEVKSFRPCWHGLRVCGRFYAAMGEGQQLHEAGEQDEGLFPVAPWECDYLGSFVRGLLGLGSRVRGGRAQSAETVGQASWPTTLPGSDVSKLDWPRPLLSGYLVL